MRITCPSCSSSFEIPVELLGKKGRELKYASCGHSWYQAAQVESLDLASIMGEDYAEKAKAAAGPKMHNEVRSANQMADKGAPKSRPGAPPVPQGAVSMMGQNQGAPQQRNVQTAGIGAPTSKPVVQAAAMSGQFMRGASGNPAPGSGQSAVSWMPSPVRQGGPGASQAVPGGQMQQPGARGGLRVPVQVKRCSNQAPWAAPVRLANQMAPWRGAQGAPSAPDSLCAGLTV